MNAKSLQFINDIEEKKSNDYVPNVSKNNKKMDRKTNLTMDEMNVDVDRFAFCHAHSVFGFKTSLYLFYVEKKRTLCNLVTRTQLIVIFDILGCF